MEPHEIQEQLEEAGHQRTKHVAVLIAALAAALAICETAGKGAQNESVIANIEASDQWAFYQAKTIRLTIAETEAGTLEALLPAQSPSAQPALTKQIDSLHSLAKRLASDPQTHEGRDELAKSAKEAEGKRDAALASLHNFEFGAAALQLAIVLASASVITRVAFLALGGIGLGLVGIVLSLFGWFAPTLLPL